MIATPSSLILGADDNLDPFERRFPEQETFLEEVVDADSYSPEQAQQMTRLMPIKFCTYPEYWLDEAAPGTIPQDHREHPESYNVRKTRALTCFEPYYSHLVDLIVGTALRKGVILPQDVPPQWEEFFKNVDLQGNAITSFTKELFTKALNGGVAGIWSEYPRMRDGITSAEEIMLNARPYFVIIPTDDVLDIRDDRGPVTINGVTRYDTRVTYLRIKSEIRRPSLENEHFEEVIPTVVVYDLIPYQNPGSDVVEERVRCRIYEKDTGNENVNRYLLNEGMTTILSLSFIPFRPCYGGKKEAFFRARPLLYDVARLNLHHWAVSADLSENIHLNASTMLTGTGIRPDEEIFSGAGRALFSANPDARFGMLSPGMEGADTTLKELARIEAAMDKLAAVTMTPGKTQVESGFAKLLDRSQSDSQLAVLISSLQDCLNAALMYASAYRNYPPIEITISKNFIPVKLHSQQVMAYSSLFKDSNAIPIGTFLEMLDAGELFEGLPNFSVKTLLEKMGLEGSETAKDLGIGPNKEQLAPEPPATNNMQNTMEEATGRALEGESMEASVESRES
jgi:hypothetical protein